MAATRSADAETNARPLVPGDILELSCTDLLATGQAVGRAGGMVVFAWGPLPGERARVRVTLVKKQYAVAELVELLEASPERVLPFCEVFGVCGGCQVQHLAYPAQLVWKRAVVHNALQRIGGIADARVSVPIGMDEPRAYRNKMSLVVGDAGGARSLGFYQARSHHLVPIRSCPVVLPELDAYIAGLWDAASAPETAAAFDGAKHIVARLGRATGHGVVSVTTDRASQPLAERAAGVAQRLPGAVGISNSYEAASANAVLGRKQVQLFGAAEIEERIDGIRFRVSAASFFQINSEMVGRIFEFLKPHIAGVTRIVDLYCGAGTFALFFARGGARVVGIEENPHAIREARRNAELNGLEAETTFLAGRVDARLREAAGLAALRDAGVVFLDPPRKGSDEATLDALVAAAVPRLWYLSCNPATLARDLARLLRGGYRLGIVQPFDMFPQTGHIEALALLEFAGREEEQLSGNR